MKKPTFAALLLAVSTAVPAQAFEATDGTWHARLRDTWLQSRGERWVSFQLQPDDGRRHGVSVQLSELAVAGVRDDRWTGDLLFGLQRDAGTIDFRGRFEDGVGAGTYRFSASPDYAAAMARAGYGVLTNDRLFRLAAVDVSRSFAASIQQQGYTTLSIDDLVKMRIHGVTPEFIKEMRDLGFKDLRIEELVELRIHGVTPTYVREMRELGFKDLGVAELKKMRIHGVTPAFVKELRELGYTNATAADLVKMRIHGITPQFIREMKGLTGKGM